MDIFDVNIYIETSIRGPEKAKQAAGEWLVEFVTAKGIPVTRRGLIVRDNVSGNVLPLELLREALSVLTKTCRIQVNTCCKYILGTVQNGRLAEWRKNGWSRAGGRPLKNKELWQQVSELMDDHVVKAVCVSHSYRNVMQEDIKKELERIKKNE